MKPVPASLSTSRLGLRRPTLEDASEIFAYAGDAEVTRYMSWPTHRDVSDSHRFLKLCEREWGETGFGPYVILLGGAVIGSTGLHRLAPDRVATGYILRRDAWGHGYATEAARAMVALGQTLGLPRIEAQCHASHLPSARVLEKVGFVLEGIRKAHSVFPNFHPDPQDVRAFAWIS